MKLQSLPKVLCPIALAVCALAAAQETPPADPAKKAPEDTQNSPPIAPPAPVPATDTPAADPALEPPAPTSVETIPADPSQVPVTPPADAPLDPVVPVAPEDGAPLVPETPLITPDSLTPEADATTQENLGPAPEVTEESSASLGAPPLLTPGLSTGSDADAMGSLDVATPDIEGDHEWLRGLTFGGSLSAMYDSNVFQASGLRTAPKTDDIVFGFKPFVAYGSENYGLNYSAKLILDAQEFVDNDDLNSVGYDSGISLGYDGKKLLTSVDLSQALVNGVDRNYGTYVERELFRFTGKMAYKVSRKTNIEGRVGYSSESPDDPRFFDTSRQFANLALSWQYSPLLRVGGGLGWSESEGDRQLTRDTIGPLLRLNYTFSKKLTFEGETGLDFVSYDAPGASDDTFVSAKIAAKYVPSPFWAFNFSVLRDSEPDGSIAGAYRDIFAIRGAIEKKIAKATVVLGLGYEQNEYTRPQSNSGSVAGLDRDYYTIDLSATYPLYKDVIDLQVFTKYRDEDAVDNTRSWSGSQYGVALKSTF